MAIGDWAEALAIFRCFDKNGDGMLEPDELGTLLHQARVTHATRRSALSPPDAARARTAV
eukprot:7174475-Prymnesium_polylepis.1